MHRELVLELTTAVVRHHRRLVIVVFMDVVPAVSSRIRAEALLMLAADAVTTASVLCTGGLYIGGLLPSFAPGGRPDPVRRTRLSSSSVRFVALGSSGLVLGIAFGSFLIEHRYLRVKGVVCAARDMLISRRKP